MADPEKTRRDLTQATRNREQAQRAETDAIVQALQPGSGVRQAEVAAITGYSREHLRKLARAHGIESTRSARPTR